MEEWQTIFWISWIILAYVMGRIHQYDRDWPKMNKREGKSYDL